MKLCMHNFADFSIQFLTKIKLKKWKENMNLVSLCECFYYDLDVTQNALEKASAGGKYTTWQQGDPF